MIAPPLQPPPHSPDSARRAEKARYASTRAREGAHLQHQLLEGIRALGWRAIASHSVRLAGGRWTLGLRGNVAGVPDFPLLVRDGQFKVREVKLADHTALSEEQEAWLADLRAAGVDAAVWRGSRIDEILEELR